MDNKQPSELEKKKAQKKLPGPVYNRDDSSDEGDYESVNQYNELGAIARLLQEKVGVITNLGLDNEVVRLSFISHLLGVELLYSEEVSKSYYVKKTDHLLYQRSTSDVLDVTAFEALHEMESFIKSVPANRFLNRNVKRVIKAIKKGEEPDYVQLTKNPPAKNSPNKNGPWVYDYETSISFETGVNIKNKHQAHTKSTATRSHKVVTGLPRDDYEGIAEMLNAGGTVNIATAIRSILNDDIESLSHWDSQIKAIVTAITSLLFMCETSRNPAAYLHNQMLLDLLIDGQIDSWHEALVDLMPMGPVGSVDRARSVEDIYRDYLPVKYTYDYKDGKSNEHNILIKKEAVLTKKWLDYKGFNLNTATTKEIVDRLKEAIIDWYNIDLRNEDSYLYNDADIRILLQHQLPDQQRYEIAPSTQFESEEQLEENVGTAIQGSMDGRVVVMPIHLHENDLNGGHWTGAIFRRQGENGPLQVIYVDPIGSPIDQEANYNIFRDAIVALAPTAQILDLANAEFIQQANDRDCGPFTVSNLINLARAGNQLNGLSALQIVELNILERSADGSADHLRSRYEAILNPLLASDAATRPEQIVVQQSEDATTASTSAVLQQNVVDPANLDVFNMKSLDDTILQSDNEQSKTEDNDEKGEGTEGDDKDLSFFVTDIIYDDPCVYDNTLYSNINKRNENNTINQELIDMFAIPQMVHNDLSKSRFIITIDPSEMFLLDFEQLSYIMGMFYNWYAKDSISE